MIDESCTLGSISLIFACCKGAADAGMRTAGE